MLLDRVTATVIILDLSAELTGAEQRPAPPGGFGDGEGRPQSSPVGSGRGRAPGAEAGPGEVRIQLSGVWEMSVLQVLLDLQAFCHW